MASDTYFDAGNSNLTTADFKIRLVELQAMGFRGFKKTIRKGHMAARIEFFYVLDQ
jgi:hypothetical protein